MKSHKILKLFLVAILSLQIITVAILTAKPAAADDPNYNSLNYTPQVQLPVAGSGLNQNSTNVGSYNSNTGVMTSDLLARYIKAIYTYGQMIAGILAAIVLMAGGLLWLTSAGNDAKITQAKELISGSIIGLVILFGSWILLNTINPALLNMQVITTKVVQTKEFNIGGWITTTTGLKNTPSDFKKFWICAPASNASCIDIDPTYISLDTSLCKDIDSSGQSCSNNQSNLLRCCGYSDQDIKNSNSFCAGKTTGKGCKLNYLSSGFDGYCENSKCLPCKKVNAECSGGSKDYECPTAYGFCGNENSNNADCNCNLVGDNCTCEQQTP
jgi:hypothetical protein